MSFPFSVFMFDTSKLTGSEALMEYTCTQCLGVTSYIHVTVKKKVNYNYLSKVVTCEVTPF